MIFRFTITDNGDLPIVYIDDVYLNVVHLTYSWSTKTEEVGSGGNICIVDGYLGGGLVLRRFIFNLMTGAVNEVTINSALGPKNSRVFEVCTTRGECYDSEIWEVRPFESLKPRDIIRIRDGGVQQWRIVELLLLVAASLLGERFVFHQLALDGHVPRQLIIFSCS